MTRWKRVGRSGAGALVLCACTLVAAPALASTLPRGPADIGPGFRPVDLTDRLAARAFLETASEDELPRPDGPPPTRNLLPGPLEAPDVVLIEADRCGAGCIIGEPTYQQGLAFYEFDHYAAVNHVYGRSDIEDDYDVVIFWTTFHTTFFGGAYYSPVANDILGINADQGRFSGETYNFGPRIYGGTALYGIVLMQDWFHCEFWTRVGVACTLDPPHDESFYSPYATLAQEVGHQWGSFVEVNRGSPTALLGRDDAHWSYFMHSGGSPMEGNHWLDNGNGTFTVQSTLNSAYAPIDLYLMGLMAPEDVGELWYIANPDPAVEPGHPPWPLPGAGGRPGPQTVTGERASFDIYDVIAREGDRVPTWQESPKLHRQLWVLVHLPIDELAGSPSETDTTEEIQGRLHDLGKMRRHWNEMFYRITRNTMRGITTASGRDDHPYWRFRLSPEGWSPTDPVKVVLANRDDRMVMTANIHAPGIEHHSLKVDTAGYQSVRIAYAASPGSEGPGRLSWAVGNTGAFTNDQSVELPTAHDGQMHTYVVPLAEHPAWQGLVSGLRLVPVDRIAGDDDETHISLLELSPYAVSDDADGDLHADGDDNCPEVANPGLADADGDGIGDACEADSDGDGVIDDDDLCPDDAEDRCPDARGCGCTTTAPDGVFGLALVLSGLFLQRRRSS